jgi:hypothetical protein
LRKTEWSEEFEHLMRNRLLIGAYRYGRLYNKICKRPNASVRIRQLIEQYEETGNLELMVDIANFAMTEFINSKHPKKHFKAKNRS